MKKAIIALSVFSFVIAFAVNSSDAVAKEVNAYTLVSPADQDPPKTQAAKTSAEMPATAKSSCGDKSAKAAGDCSKPCGDKDKSASASADCGSKKATTTTAAVVSPDKK
ncbi:MAG: hypothetical protein RBS07_04680 [Lentimicrobium sp.]|jgi:hypothetical protein|nr:hypothetical protein [Lentimicrobium sp.]